MKKIFLWTSDMNAGRVCRAVCYNQGYFFESGELEITELYSLATINGVLIIDTRNQKEESVQGQLIQLEKQWKRPVILVAEQPGWRFRYSYHIETITDIHSDIEVLFAVNKIMTMVEKIAKDEKIIVHRDLTINLNTYEVYFGKALAELTYKETKILGLLAKTPEQVYSREQILYHLGIKPLGKEERSVDHVIKRLRKKISQNLQWQIKTAYGKGYMFYPKNNK